MTVPHAIESERTVLASAMADLADFPAILSLRPEEFFGIPERSAFEAIMALERAGKRRACQDIPAVWDQLQRQGDGGKFQDGMQHLVEWCSYARVGQQDFHVGVIKDRHARREMALTGRRLLDMAADLAQDSAALLSASQTALATILEGEQELAKVAAWDEFPEEMESRVMARAQGKQVRDRGIPIGIGSLDTDLFQGARPGNTVVLAAPPGGGKSSMARQWSLSVLEREGSVLYFSLEDPKEDVREAMYAAHTGISSLKLANGLVDYSEFKDGIIPAKRVMSRDLVIADQIFEIARIEAAVTQWAGQRREVQEKLVIVDYLQIVDTPDMGKASRFERISDISRRLKLLSMRAKVPIVVVAQFNRVGLKGDELTMHDLEGSGSIEKDASCVMFVVAEKNDQDQFTGDACFRIVKQRRGPTGRLPLKWSAKTYTFSDVE